MSEQANPVEVTAEPIEVPDEVRCRSFDETFDPQFGAEPQPGDDPAAQVVRSVLDALLDQGLLWARYGLTAGRRSLEVQARAMEVLAASLGRIAEALPRTGPRAAERRG